MTKKNRDRRKILRILNNKGFIGIKQLIIQDILMYGIPCKKLNGITDEK